MVRWLRSVVQRPSDRISHWRNHVGVPPSRAKSTVPVYVICVEVTSHQVQQSATERGGQVRTDQWAGRRKVSRKDYRWFAVRCDFSGSSLQVVQARNGHILVDYTTADQDGCAAPVVNLSVRCKT